MQIQTWLKLATKQLTDSGVESARLDCQLLLEHVTQKSKEWLLAHGDENLQAPILKTLNKLVLQRKNHVPLAYIIGSKEFYGREFLVSSEVLIPRPESEAMIGLLKNAVRTEPKSGQILRQAPSYAKASADRQDDKVRDEESVNTIIDIGTGSGCLAATAKLLYPGIHVTAIDVSPAALSVAKKNARKFGLQIQFRLLDIYKSLPAMPKTRPYIILANLPYVPSGLVTSVEITKEPKEALFSGEDGLDHYRKFWEQIGKLKNKPSYIITESLKSQHNSLIGMANKAGYTLKQASTLAQLFVKNNPRPRRARFRTATQKPD